MKPVHSPAPLSTAPPAGSGRANASSASTRHADAGAGDAAALGRWRLVADAASCGRGRPRRRRARSWWDRWAGTRSRFPGRERAAWAHPASSAAARCRCCRHDAAHADAMPIPVVWSPETRRHEPMREVWVGVPTEGTEVPARVDRILEALAGARPRRGGAATTTTCCLASTTRRSSTTCARSTPSGSPGRTTSWSARTGSCPTSSRRRR